jgi:hypothetical protein
MNLTTQTAKVACFRNAAAHLEPGGCFPITTSHPHAEQAAEAAEGAAAQGRFWEMHDHLYENQQHLSEDDLHSYARVLDLDLDLFGKGRARARRRRSGPRGLPERRSKRRDGTPTFFINGRRHDDSYESETLLMALQRAAELGREIADRHADVVAAGLRAQPRYHRLRQVDPVHRHTAPRERERERDPAGPDPELERASFSGERGEDVDGQVNDGGVERLPLRLVVRGGDALVEVPVVVHGSNLSRRLRHDSISSEVADRAGVDP